MIEESFDITVASSDDLPELVKLRHKTYSHFAPDHYSKTEVETLLSDVDEQHWQEMIDDKRVFITKRNRIIGCCGWDKQSVRHIYIDPDFAKSGIGSRLLKYTENDFLKRTEYKEIIVGIAVYARPFYEKNGYLFLSQEKDWDGSAYYKMKKTLASFNSLL